VSFAETFGAVWRWARGIGPDWRQRHREARLVDEIADLMARELDEENETSLVVRRNADETSLKSHGRDKSHGGG
jgi:hypothetical protein